ncbi:MAG TPA: hypothetical protein VHP33_40415 [Polyangiaceae bacterium]|jgi:hypothetical protein|nr:hypothetical protein [Polyangiaceae bacterium]
MLFKSSVVAGVLFLVLAGCGVEPDASVATAGQAGAAGSLPQGSAGGGQTGIAGATASAAGTGAITEAGAPGGGAAGAAIGGQTQGGEPTSGGQPSAGSGGQPMTAGPSTHDELILYDDDGKLWYVNNAEPAKSWSVSSGSGRDLQLVGSGRVMLGKGNGWDEYQLSDGKQVAGQHGFAGTQSAHRLADGTTMLASVSNNSILLKMVTSAGQVQRTITYAGYGYVRLVRPTAASTFLVTADTLVFEGDDQGKVLKTWTIPGKGQHVWKALRLASGNTVIATGYNATLMVFGPDQSLLKTIGGKGGELSALDPHFFAGFTVRPNGNYFVVNSQADSNNDKSVQLLEFDPDGKLTWQQKQPATVRSLEEAIVLDGLDTSKLQIETTGPLMSAP